MFEKKDIREIQGILGGLAARRQYRDIDMARLEALFSRFEVPQPPFDPILTRARINEKIDARTNRSRAFAWTRARAAFAGALAVLAVISATIYFSPPFGAGKEDTLVQLAYGDTRMVRDGKDFLLQGGEKLLPGDVVLTGEASFADLSYRDDIKIRIKEHTRLLISEMTHMAGGALSSEMEISRGTILLDFRKLAHGDNARIKTPTSVAGVRGTSFGIMVGNDTVRYEVLDGKIAVANRPPEQPGSKTAGADKRTAESLRAYFEQNAVVVGRNEICVMENREHERLSAAINALVAEKHGTGAVDPARLREIAEAASVPRVYKKEFGDPVMLSELRGLSRASTVLSDTPVLRTIKITAVPVTAEILMDGERKGNGSIAAVTTEGMHAIEVRARGYHPRRLEYTVKADEELSVGLDRILERQFNFTQWLSGSKAAFVVATRHGGLVSISREGRIEAVSRGRLDWEFDCAVPVHTQPVADTDVLYIATADERIIALSLADGSLKWMQRLEGALSPGSRLALAPDSVIAGTAKGYLYSFTRNGWLNWSIMLPAPVSSAPALSGHLIFVPCGDGMVYGIDLHLHLLVLKFQSGKIAGATVAVKDGRVFIATMHGEIMCYNYGRDEIEWRASVRTPILSDPVIVGDALYIATTAGDVYRYSLKGGKAWRYSTGNKIESNLMVDESGVHVLTDKTYYVLDTAEGSVKWSFVIPSQAVTGVAFTTDNVYFGTEGNGIIQLKR